MYGNALCGKIERWCNERVKTDRQVVPGSRVLTALLEEPEFNLKCGHVYSFDEDTKHFYVKLDDGTDITVPLECLCLKAQCTDPHCNMEQCGH